MDITPVILTLNEEANIGRSLERLTWAPRVVVVDSFSTDRTPQIAKSFPNVQFVQRPFDCHANQWNFAVHETNIGSEWILALDADYLLTEEFAAELRALVPTAAQSAFEAAFIFCIHGIKLPGNLYPPIPVLYRRGKGRYFQDGHTQRLNVDGAVRRLRSRLLLDDRKPLEHWVTSQRKYAYLEALKILKTPVNQLGMSSRIRKLKWISPVLVPLYSLFVKRCILAGPAGLVYAVQRCVFECLLALYLYEMGRGPTSPPNPSPTGRG